MTYSIVARDPRSGELGVSVQSHYFQVGPVVPWAAAGIGAVATQARVNVAYGPLGLELMRAGWPAEQALAAVTAADPEREMRQVAMVDAAGGAAAHTGGLCIAEAGHRLGAGFSVQANLMEKDTVWDAMAAGFERSAGPLAERMLAALESAEAEGGDIRGRQSAAMLVVSGEPTGRPWEDRLIDLRVEDHPDPLGELRRLLRLKRAYQAAANAELETVRGDLAAAARSREEAVGLAPEAVQLRFFAALALAREGALDRALPLLREVLRVDPRWRETMRRLVPAGQLPAEVAAELDSRLGAGASEQPPTGAG